jgi:LysR family transcriptional regulator, benzoate and cis,cis-muconate-responsive activator of ben and cat genes
MNDYSLRELECFVAVADELSFTRAARRIHLAQPPLSRHIKALETRLGARLFERSKRTVALTAAGRAFLIDTRGALSQLQRAGEAAKRAARGETARLELGFVSAVVNPALLELFQKFRRSHPEVQLTLHDILPADQLRAIVEGRIDGGFVGMTPTNFTAGLEYVPWQSEPLLLFLPPEHRLARSRRVALRDLANESFVAVSAEASPAFSSKFHQLCRAAGFRPRIVQEGARAQAVAAMVAAGSGIAILPASLARFTGKAVATAQFTGTGFSITHMFAHRRAIPGESLLRFKALLSSR